MGHRDRLVQAGAALARHGLVSAFGHVSIRDGADTFVITPPTALNAFTADEVQSVGLGVTELPSGTPKEAWIHHEIYRRRPDVRAICRSQPPVATALASAGVAVQPIHGQGSFLGAEVSVHPDSRLVRDQAAGTALAETLGESASVIMRGNGAVTVGSDVESAVALMWVLEASAQLNATAASVGTPEPLSLAEQEAWRSVAPELLARIWLHVSREEN
jgi:HCOMODA/2-hydroxy-3-carboxy-muconic semialdehyde decarboxylase